MNTSFAISMPQSISPPIYSALFKSTPSDFIVHEVLPDTHTFTEQGEHLWLYLEKTGVNTQHLARLLSQWAHCPLSDIGYSGIKDRHAITRQWFSLRLPKGLVNNALDRLTPWLQARLTKKEAVTLLDHAWHQRKLSRATHQYNYFIIQLRQLRLKHDGALDGVDKDSIDAHLAQLATAGVPNYFGEQRFGRHHSNVHKFLTSTPTASKYRKTKRADKEDSLLISAARSLLFNAILAKRVISGTWQQPLIGEVFTIDGTESLFVADIDADIIARMATGEIHATAPLLGVTGMRDLVASAAVAEIENGIIQHPEFNPIAQKLYALGIRQSRRSLRLKPRHLTWLWQDDTLRLEFSLPAGSFATAVLHALVHAPQDASILAA